MGEITEIMYVCRSSAGCVSKHATVDPFILKPGFGQVKLDWWSQWNVYECDVKQQTHKAHN